jgi:hypothetical protein
MGAVTIGGGGTGGATEGCGGAGVAFALAAALALEGAGAGFGAGAAACAGACGAGVDEHAAPSAIVAVRVSASEATWRREAWACMVLEPDGNARRAPSLGSR